MVVFSLCAFDGDKRAYQYPITLKLKKPHRLCVRGGEGWGGGANTLTAPLWLGWLMRVVQVKLQGTSWQLAVQNTKRS